MDNKVPKTIVSQRPGTFSELGDIVKIAQKSAVKDPTKGKKWRTHSRLKYIALILIVIVLSYAFRGYWLGPMIKSKLETVLSSKLQSNIDVELVRGNYINYFELYNVSIADSRKNSDSHISKISVYFSFWKMLGGSKDWINIINAQDGKITINLMGYLRGGKPMKLPDSLPAMNFKNLDLSVDFDGFSLKFSEFSCTLWSSGRIIAQASELQGYFSNYTFAKSNFEFDARWRDQLLGIDTMAIAGQNTAEDLVLDFSEGKKSIISILGRIKIDQSQMFIDGKIDLSAQKQSTLQINQCQVIKLNAAPLYSLVPHFPIQQGEITGSFDGLINLDLFSNSTFEYDVEIIDAVINDIDMPILSGVGNFDAGILSVDSGNWVQVYDYTTKRRLQARSLKLDISKLSDGKLSTIEGEIILSSDEQFQFLKNLSSDAIPDGQYLLKAVFNNNQVLVFGTLKDDFKNVVNINRLILTYNEDDRINLKNIAENTAIDGNIDFNIKDFVQFRTSFPEFNEILDIEGQANGSLLIEGTSQEGRIKVFTEINSLTYKDTRLIDVAEISALFEWDSIGTSIKMNRCELHRGTDNAVIEGLLRLPKTEYTYTELIKENLQTLNLSLKVEELGYYAQFLKTEIPSGSCEISLVSNPTGDQLGLFSMKMDSVQYDGLAIETFRTVGSIFKDKIVVSEIFAENQYGACQGAFYADFTNSKHISLVLTKFEYFYEMYRISLTQDADFTIKDDKILVTSLEMSGNIGELDLSALVFVNDEYFDVDLLLKNLNGNWIHKLIFNNTDHSGSFGIASVKLEFQGTFSSFESQTSVNVSEISLQDVPEFNLSFLCSADHELITLSNIVATDFTRAQRSPLMTASTSLPVNIFELTGLLKADNRIFGLDKIKAACSLNFESLNWLKPLIPDSVRPAGNCKMNVKVGGTFDIPEAQASVKFDDLDFADVDDEMFFKFFSISDVLRKNIKGQKLKNFKDCSLGFNLNLLNRLIKIADAELLLKYLTNDKQAPALTDKFNISGNLQLTGNLSDVILMQDSFRIGEGFIKCAGDIEKVSKFPILSNIVTDLEGAMKFDLSVSSPWVAPRFNGSASFEKGTAQLFNDIHPITDLSAKIEFEDRQVYVFNIRGNSGGALLRGNGTFLLADSDINLNLNLFGKSILFKRTENLVLRADVDINITDTLTNPLIKGSLKFDDSEYSEYFNVFSRLDVLDLSNSTGFLSNARIDIHATNQSAINVNTSFISGKASLNLQLTGTVNEPRTAGIIDISNANMNFPAMKFHYPVLRMKFDPEKDEIILVGTGAGSEFGYSVDMKIAGKIGEPEFIVKSKPATNNDEILEMIIFGKKPAKIQPGAGIAPVQKITLFVPKDLLDRIFTIKNQNKDFILERMEVKEFTNYSKNDREMFLLRFYLASPSDETSETFAFELERDKYDTLNMGFAFVIRFK